jgi:hypothetical protein
MAIKKRPQVDPETEAKIEAFGAAAENPAPTPAPAPAAAPARTTRAASAAARKPAERTGDVAKTFLVRWPDDELPLLLAEVSALEDRSQHAVALRALRRGLEAMKADAGK